MSERFDHGPLKSFEVTWTSGHVETIQAHQVTFPVPSLFLGDLQTKHQDFIKLHGEINGRWQLILAARPELISMIRDKATEEAL
jgi:hypothetical protein